MPLTRSRFIRLLRIGGAVLALILIAGYIIWRSLDYARGPAIRIFEPQDGATVASSTAELVGRADRINMLTLDDRPISVDERGNFRETIAVFPGLNRITMRATDQFQRETRLEIRIFRPRDGAPGF